MKKIFLSIIMLVVLGSAAMAQEEYPSLAGHHLYIGARGGVAEFLLKENNPVFIGGTPSFGSAMAIDVHYGYFWNEHWGIRTGLNVATLMSHFAIDYAGNRVDSVAIPLDPYTDRVKFYNTIDIDGSDIKESYDAFYIELPIQLAWQNLHWYANLGVKAGLPFFFKVKGRGIDHLIYQGEAAALQAGMPELNFAQADSLFKQNYEKASENVIPFTLSGIFDFGYRTACTCGDSWMIGVYGEFGLINTGKECRSEYYHAVGYTNETYEVNGNAFAAQANRFANFFSFGIKVQYDFGLSRNK